MFPKEVAMNKGFLIKVGDSLDLGRTSQEATGGLRQHEGSARMAALGPP